MRERGILFGGEMVRAILEGRKTQTRRLGGLEHVNGEPDAWVSVGNMGGGTWLLRRNDSCTFRKVRCPCGAAGDRLWVRETWASFGTSDSIDPPVERQCQIRYHADNTCIWKEMPDGEKGVFDASFRLRPSIHMPRWASRISLEVTGVRLERLQSVGEEEAEAEGVGRIGNVGAWRDYRDEGNSLPSAVQSFASLWAGVYGEESWDANPWVWVVGFGRVEA